METKLASIKNKKIRRTRHGGEWWYVVEDVVCDLTDSKDPKRYIRRMKRRDPELGKGWGQITTPLPIETEDRIKTLECANMESIFRIIQSIRTPKPEPCKQWLAKVGHERIQEFLDPESAARHQRSTAKPKGIRKSGSVNASGPMTNLDSILSLLSEAATAEIAGRQDTEGSDENEMAARKGAWIVEEARKRLEVEAGGKVSMHRVKTEITNCDLQWVKSKALIQIKKERKSVLPKRE